MSAPSSGVYASPMAYAQPLPHQSPAMVHASPRGPPYPPGAVDPGVAYARRMSNPTGPPGPAPTPQLAYASQAAVPGTAHPTHEQQLAIAQRFAQQQARGQARPVPVHAHASSSSSAVHLALPQDAGPPHKVPVRSFFSRVTPVAPGADFPRIEAGDQLKVKRWIDRDVEYERELASARKGKRAEVFAIAEDHLYGQDWLGPQAQPGTFRIRWGDEKDREQAAQRRGPLRKPIKLTKRQLRSAASRPEVLVPVRLDIEHEAWKLRDTFTWNLLESDISPETFATHLCADLRLPERPFVKEIISTISKTLEDAKASEQFVGHLGDGGTSAIEENREWFVERAERRRRRNEGEEGGQEPAGPETEEEQAEIVSLDQLDVPLDMGSEELRITIKLDITLDSIQLVDRFEWDISNSRNSPEDFAESFASELGLTGEFRTAIAHSIREQVDNYVRSLSALGFVPGAGVPDEDLRREFLPAVFDVFRSDGVEDYTPNLNYLTPDEIDRNDKEREREVRRKRRQTKGRGVTLPDREAVKTHRTLVPRPLPGLMQAQSDGGDVVYPLPELSYPYPIVVKPLPPKPAGLDTPDSSPLRLVSKDRGNIPAPTQSLRGAALANALAKRSRLESAALANGDYALLNGATVDAFGRLIPRKLAPGQFPTAAEVGMHEHIIDGKWFCANCGIPDTIAVGRRKGPTGVDSLCGTCGKFYHRFKKQRPCTYTTDLDTHLREKAEQEAKAKAAKSRKRGGAAAASVMASLEGTPALDDPRRVTLSGQQTPASQALSPASSFPVEGGDDSDDTASAASPRKRRRAAHYGSPDTAFVQPDSDSGSDSEEGEGGGSPPVPRSTRQSAPAQSPVPPTTPAPAPAPAPPPEKTAPSAPVAPPAGQAPTPAPQPLPWMQAAAAEIRSKQVDDRFELIPRPRPADPAVQEWRIRCLDCPGKLYNLGPGETLDGFLVHFKNRLHRSNVEARLARERGAQ
ncbi:hypothetical protein JCM10212_003415 [Sporobolomyces blumeae]